MRTPPILLILGLQLLRFDAVADIADQHALVEIAQKCQTRFFIETTVSTPRQADTFPAFYRVEMLARMLKEDNAPPDLVKAIAAAYPNAEVSSLPNKGLLIVDKAVNAKLLASFNQTPVSISHFSGKLRDLFATIKVPSGNLMLNQVFTESDSRTAVNMNFAIKDFSFDGSVKDLLIQIATDNGPTTSFTVAVTKEYAYVRFFAYTNLDPER